MFGCSLPTIHSGKRPTIENFLIAATLNKTLMLGVQCAETELRFSRCIAQNNAHIHKPENHTVYGAGVIASVWKNNSYCQSRWFIKCCLPTDFSLVCFQLKKRLFIFFVMNIPFIQEVLYLGCVRQRWKKKKKWVQLGEGRSCAILFLLEGKKGFTWNQRRSNGIRTYHKPLAPLHLLASGTF